MSAYDVTQETLGGKCDLGLALGLLHRVPDPYTLIMKTDELADAVVYEWAALKSEEPIMRFWGGGLEGATRQTSQDAVNFPQPVQERVGQISWA
jgi:hypothetical protein